MRKATNAQMMKVLDKLQEMYRTNFTTDGLLDGYENFEMDGKEFMEGFNMLLDMVAEGNMPEETHGTALAALVMFYVHSRKQNVPGFGAIHNMTEKAKENN